MTGVFGPATLCAFALCACAAHAGEAGNRAANPAAERVGAPSADATAGPGAASTAPASTEGSAALPLPDCPRAATLEPAAIEAEVVCLLRHYVRLDTTNPPGNERIAAEFLAGVLARDGIETRILESGDGRANIYARLRAESASEKALLLMHHMDVVPATASDWSVPPFAGELREGYVWGRGAFDNKGGGAVTLLSVLMLKRLGVPLKRDIILLGVADEEAGGGAGARFVVEQHADLFRDVGFVLNEGGAILKLGPELTMYSIELAQKAPLWLRLTARGPSGHGSTPRDNAATHVLVRALGRLEAYRFPIVVLPEVKAVLAARAKDDTERARMLALERSLRNPAFRERVLSVPQTAALLRNTVSITMLAGGDKENVLSSEASAVLDVRLLPGQDAAEVTAQIVKVLAEPAIEVDTLLSWQAHASPRDSELFAAIEAFAKQHDPTARVEPSVLAGFTDCNAFRAKKITCYGFLPLRITFDEIGRIHGKDERISVDSLTQGVLDLVALAQLFAGTK